MIAAHFDNIENYSSFDEIYRSLNFLKTLDKNTPIGKYIISDKSHLIISEYNSIIENNFKFEKHIKYIDIQYSVNAYERIEWMSIHNAKSINSYDEKTDRSYYVSGNDVINEVTIGNRIFCIFFPEDIHNPCLSYNGKSYPIRKWTVKIKV